MLFNSKKILFWAFAWCAVVYLLIGHLKKQKNMDMSQLNHINTKRLSDAQTTDVIISIGDNKITLGDLNREYARHKSLVPQHAEQARTGASQYKQLRKNLLGQMIENKIIFTYLEKVKSSLPEKIKNLIDQCETPQDTPQENNGHSPSCYENTVQQYIQTSLAAPIEVSSSEVKDFYDANKEKFKTNERILIQHILVEKESLAKKISYRLKKSNFLLTAVEHSIAPEGSSGGYLGPFEKGELPYVFDSAFSLKKDQISKIHKSAYGFHIFHLVEKYEPGYKSSFETKNDINLPFEGKS